MQQTSPLKTVLVSTLATALLIFVAGPAALSIMSTLGSVAGGGAK